MKNHLGRSIRLTNSDLHRVGTDIVSIGSVVLRCMSCGQTWEHKLLPGGHLPKGWWQCPNKLEKPDHQTPKSVLINQP